MIRESGWRVNENLKNARSPTSHRNSNASYKRFEHSAAKRIPPGRIFFPIPARFTKMRRSIHDENQLVSRTTSTHRFHLLLFVRRSFS